MSVFVKVIIVCHADLYTVSRCCTRGESKDYTSEKTRNGSILALKPRTDMTRSPEQGYQWPHDKGLMSSKNFKKHSANGDGPSAPILFIKQSVTIDIMVKMLTETGDDTC